MKKLLSILAFLVSSVAVGQVTAPADALNNVAIRLDGGDPLTLGTVNSVGLSAPVEFTLSGSPVTSSGTLALSWASQLKNLVLASPDNASGIMSIRALVPRDLGATAATGLCLKGNSATTMDWQTCSASSAYSTVMDEGGALTQRSNLDFAGAGVSCVDSGGTKTLCTISGSASSVTGTGFWHSTAGSLDAASKLVDTADINASQVTYAKIQNSGVGLAVLGRSANSTGVLADIAASASSGAVLRESSSVLGFGTIATAGIANNAVTNAKAAQMATQTFKGNNTTATADPIDITAAQAASILALDTSYILIREEFFTPCTSSGTCGTMPWRGQFTGSGANDFEVDDGTAHPGVVDLQTGTTTTGLFSLYAEDSGQTGGLRLGGGAIVIKFALKIPTLSDGTNTYTTRVGLARGPNTGTQGVWVEYAQATDTHWRICTTKNSTQTCTNTANTVTAGQWDYFEIDINAAATSVDFKINGSTASGSPLSTNIPDTAGVAPVVEILKSAGTTSRSLYADYYIYYQSGLTTNR